MRARRAILILAALMALAPTLAQARVHRRSVGPVILDLGPLPPAPVAPAPPVPEATTGASSTPTIAEPPQSTEIATEPVSIAPVYPIHAQPLAALVVAIHTHTATVDEDIRVMIAPAQIPASANVPALVSHRHPTIGADYAAFTPAIEKQPPAPAQPDGQTLPRLRSLVMWIWRLLFIAGLVALAIFIRRHRASIKIQWPPARGSAPDAGSNAANAPEIDLTRATRATHRTQAPAADSLSLLTGRPPVNEQPPAAPKDLGLIEPGETRPFQTPRGSA